MGGNDKEKQAKEDAGGDGAGSAVTAPRAPLAPSQVVVHPLVLLSVVDHYNRAAKDTRKRVVGVLLGETYKGRLDVTNSFALPFEEDKKDPNIWFLDHNYLENMYNMFRRVNAKERVLGFYSTGPDIRPADLNIDALFRRLPFGPKHPVLVIVNIKPDDAGVPVKAYRTVDEAAEKEDRATGDGADGGGKRTFIHIDAETGATEAEDVGVECLLRDINDPSRSTLAGKVGGKLAGIKGLQEKLEAMRGYLQDVLDGKMVANDQIIYQMQSIFFLLPNMKVEALVKAMMVKTNDVHLSIYLGSLVRSIVALHELVNNKVRYKQDEDDDDPGAKARKKKEAEAAAKKKKEADKAKEEEEEKRKRMRGSGGGGGG